MKQSNKFLNISSQKSWGYQKGNKSPYIEEEQTTQWPKEKGQKDKQRSTKHTHKTKDCINKQASNLGELNIRRV